MIKNAIYRTSLEKAICNLPLNKGSFLVTGASGLIGSCLIDMLMTANFHGSHFEVYALGRNLKKMSERFKAYEKTSFFHYIEQDIRRPLDKNLQVDYIIHGASLADPRSYTQHPAETMLTILQGTINSLDYCKDHKDTRMLLLSSFEVYGDNNHDEYSEKDYGAINMNNLRSCYPESKRNAELLARCYVKEYGVNTLIARLCSIYGPTMSDYDSKAHAQFIRNALNLEKVVLKSNGSQRRTYCYVIDAVTALLTILVKGNNGDVYNVSYENSVTTISDLARCISEIVGTEVVYELPSDTERFGYSPEKNCILNNEKLCSLGWKGKYSLKDGLEETLDILIEKKDYYNERNQ